MVSRMHDLKLAANLTLPIDVAGQTIAMFGIRGSGKTNTAGVMVEELLNHHYPVAVIDPTDAWWGLRAGRDGNSSGGYAVFIFGGSHGDIALQETDGKVIASFLVKEQVPIILSLRHLRKAAQRRFVTEFCEELYHLKGRDAHRTPLTVVIDEAPLFVPQKVLGETARTVGAVEDLIARGRNAGFGVVLISQRSATLNADVRTQADTIICHRVTAPLDRKAIAAWFEENASTEHLNDILQSLATLKNGEAWAWAPSLSIMSRVHMRLRRTFDSSATPRIGQAIHPPKQLTEIDIEKLKADMAESIARAKSDDPETLRRTIRELETKLHTESFAPMFSADDEQRIRLEATAAVHGEYRRRLERITALMAELNNTLVAMHTAVIQTSNVGRFLEEQITSEATRTPRPASVSTSPTVTKSAGPGMPVKRGLRRMLIALAQCPDGLSDRKLGLRAQISHSSGTFTTYLGTGRSNSWIAGDRARMVITPEGLAALGTFTPLPAGEALLSYWEGQLKAGARRMFRCLVERHPRAMTADELGAAVDISPDSGTFTTYLGTLRGFDLVEGQRLGLKASDDLMKAASG